MYVYELLCSSLKRKRLKFSNNLGLFFPVTVRDLGLLGLLYYFVFGLDVEIRFLRLRHKRKPL